MVQHMARTGSSVSTKSQAAETPKDKALKKELQAIAKKLLVLYAPWQSWTVSGCWIIGASHSSTAGVITATDDEGKEILSYVPPLIVADFLSKSGQSIVSWIGIITHLTTGMT